MDEVALEEHQLAPTTIATTGRTGATTTASRFHLGFYYDPFGWGYQPYQIGWRLWPNYYSSSYWINDPWRLSPALCAAGLRWVRYWDDAMLVDTVTGEVVDVIHNFFW